MAKETKKAELLSEKIVDHSFSLKLTPAEILEKAKEMTKIMQQRDQLESELSAIKSDFKSKISKKDADISLLSNQISSGTEWVTKKCLVIMYPKQGVKKYFFDDEFVSEETMTKEDFQLTIEENG